MGILQEIIQILVGGLTQFGTGIGTSLSSIVSAMFINQDIGGLSTYGQMVAAFGAIGLAVSLSKRLFVWLTSLGGRK